MRTTNAAIAFLAFFLCCATAEAEVTFNWATVGNPGNGPDDTGFGAVSYLYRISQYEVTNAQYTEFLNAADPTGTNARALYNSYMSSDPNGGINFNRGAANGSKYQLQPGRENKPVVFVSFFDAMRFANWLENGQGDSSTESGVYNIGDGINEIRNPIATYFIPSEDEWYKAAYHKNDGATGNYWDFPTSTDAAPFSDQPPGIGAPTQSNVANFFEDDGTVNGYNDGYAVAGSTTFSFTRNYLNDVGAYTASPSPYGTFDQGGNVNEWNEAVYESRFRTARGGFWDNLSFSLSASTYFGINPTTEEHYLGFRVATVPEPSTGLLGVLSMLGLMMRR